MSGTLAKHPDEFFTQFVLRGIKEGFRIGYDYWSQVRKISMANMPSAREGQLVVGVYLAKECAEGQVLGLFDEHMHAA